MTGLAVALALAAAVLHAGWNVRLKTSADPLRLSAVALPLGTLVMTPFVAAGWLATGRPGMPVAAWVLVAGSGLVELAYFHALSAAYRRGHVSSVYPVARGTAPLLAAAFGIAVLGERLTAAQGLGVVLLLMGIWLARPPVSSRGAVLPALLTGVLIASYTAVDRVGVRLGPWWLYTWAVFVATSLAMLPWARLGLVATAAPVGVMAVSAYALVLAALSLAPLALVAPLREASVVLVAMWGVFRLGEREGAGLKLCGAAGVLVGVALLAVG